MHVCLARMTISSYIMDTDLDLKPRHMVYGKMEQLIQKMQHSKTGVQVKSQKTFLTMIPSVFTGEDFIMSLKNQLKVPDEEAKHLATLLCHYGYIFPVTDPKVLTVKDDNSLYRFQNPHYWPSQSIDPDNVAYAIHLTKRSMRNKQKHGLEEHEQLALTKLQKMLCDKKEFIDCQARDQVRIAKERKRLDKAVIDSQERAFWRIHRPAPGQVKCIEEGPKHNFQPSQVEARKARKDILTKKVHVLRKSFAMHRVKTSQAIDMYILRAENYHDNDPFFHPVHPSNPWASDDPSFWDLCDDHTDTPTERRVRMWGLSFRDLLADRLGLAEFESFLKKEYSQENLRFWHACEQLKFAPVSTVPSSIDTIYREFLMAGSLHEVNIDSKTSQQVQNLIQAGKSGKPSRFTFQAAQEHIFLLMKKDSYARFLRSDHYKQLLNNALQPEGKKKFFNFGSRKKNMLTPSPKPKRRGSSNSGDGVDSGESMMAIGPHHSYSTGNLQELDDKSVVLRRDANSSESSLTSDTSPNLSRRHERASSSRRGSPRKSQQQQLEVPKHMSLNLDGSTRGEASCLALAVPSKTNVVAPWEGSE
ncbi:regulator of G-protein signaling 7-like isoform X2 [Babylonia areolata]|uniref:regulator of G-protein signaling 7-like isoform X2 n=1 Tax=Babylonia areolata TaxID=304850 RepID=UPI003FD55B8A